MSLHIVSRFIGKELAQKQRVKWTTNGKMIHRNPPKLLKRYSDSPVLCKINYNLHW